MDKASQNVARQVVSLLKDIKLGVDSIFGPQQEHGGSQGNKSQSAPSEATGSNPNPRKDNRFPMLAEWKPVFELVGLVVLIGYTTVAAFQWRETRSSNQIAQQALRQSQDRFWDEQRPYMWVTNVLGSPEFVRNGPNSNTGQITWTYHFTNYGKTPALGIQYREFIKLGDNPFVPTYASRLEGVGAPLPPTKDDFDTVVSEPGITPAQLAQLLETNGISIKVVFTYTDATARRYETGICLNRLNLGGISYCREGNYIK
jgi:hypothetical protein